MPHRAFFAFILPSLAAMTLFIALPIISVVVQSFYIQHERVVAEVETCSPFGGCTKEMRVDAAATEKLRQEEPLGRFNGLGTYVDRNHLAFAEIGEILSNNNGFRDVVGRIYNL
ncbi:MAG: sugar ABC transporter permease, partial [Rhizobiaceae bacterium]